MMSSRNQILATAGCFLAVVGVGGALLIWPVRTEAKSIRVKTAELRAQVANLAGTSEQVEKLRAELAQAEARVAGEFKHIPKAPVPDLMSRLSLHVDGKVVQDWSLSQGMPQAAAAGEEISAMVVPWTAEIKAQFAAVFDVLKVAESMNELVRISSVRMSRVNAGQQGAGRTGEAPSAEPVVTAAIVFEAVFDPTNEKEQP